MAWKAYKFKFNEIVYQERFRLVLYYAPFSSRKTRIYRHMLRTNLPKNLKIEIFSRLPVKSLLRFKCVCKSWYNLFKSAAFITKHIQFERDTNFNHKKRCLLVRCENTTGKYFAAFLSNETLDILLDFEMPKFGHRRFIAHRLSNSCNGIVCLYGCLLYKGSRVWPNKVTGFVMLNPATRDYKCLPLAPSPVSYPPYVSSSTHDFALGFDSRCNDYKVVRIVRLEDKLCERELPVIVQVYTLSSNSWREVDVYIPARININKVYNSYTNGIYHWIALDRKGWVILSFDFHDEVFRTKRGPNFETGFREYGFTALNGSLALILFKYGILDEPCMEVWVTNDESWSYHSTEPIRDFDKPLAIWGNIKVLFENCKGEICLYDHSTHEIRYLNIHGGRYTSLAAIYDESLVSRQGLNWSTDEDRTEALDGLSNMFSLD